VKKWSCVICNLKQSLLHVIFNSMYAKECRPVVQGLNENRGNEKRVEKYDDREDSCSDAVVDNDRDTDPDEIELLTVKEPHVRSRWDDFVDSEEEVSRLSPPVPLIEIRHLNQGTCKHL
jgi:MRN-interacting protein